MPENQPKRGRAVILTALPVEYEAVRTHLSDIHEEVHHGTIYERGNFVTAAGTWEVGIAQLGSGNAVAAFEAERAIAYFRPSIILFVGVAGGLKDVALGDVVAATKVYGYEAGKAQGSLFLARPDVGESSYGLVQRARAEARKADWVRRIQGHTLGMTSSPHVVVGAIAAGEKVVASTHSDVVTFLHATYNDALAVEMEGRGFLRATHGNEGVQALIIRGISDLLNNKRKVDTGGSQTLAAKHAAAFAYEVLAKLNAQPAPFPEMKEELRLEDIYIYEQGETPLLDITLHNRSTRTILPTRVKIEVLDLGEFYRFAEDDDEDDDKSRSFVITTARYNVVLSPDLKGQSKVVKIAHQLVAGETDRFQVEVEQDIADPALIYVWYHLKITILYDGDTRMTEPKSILLSLPPVRMLANEVWKSTTARAAQNRATVRRLSTLSATRSDSVESAMRRVLQE